MGIKNQGEIFFMGLFICIGLSMGGFFISKTMYNSKVALNTAEAKGLAERRVMADRVNWKIMFSVKGATKKEIPSLYQKAEKHQQSIIDVIKENGFTDDEIKIGALNYRSHEYRNDKQQVVDQTHILLGTIDVESNKVKEVDKVRTSVSKLIAKGINVENLEPTYHFTKLNDIKPEMLREATKNARIAASEFAQNAGVKVGSIRSARQGSFYVRDAGESYGDTKKIEKEVRVVTTISFYLTD